MGTIRAGIMMLFFTVSWIISHLGVNGLKGSKLPGDSRVIITVVVKSVEMFQA